MKRHQGIHKYGSGPAGRDACMAPDETMHVHVAKMKVTSVATELASTRRRTHNRILFKCPSECSEVGFLITYCWEVQGCGSTFTRRFNLNGHLRSHNDERPYRCLYNSCRKCQSDRKTP
jgi:hypothetical protein